MRSVPDLINMHIETLTFPFPSSVTNVDVLAVKQIQACTPEFF